jgi:methylthioribose-1-phosphate isomerase
MSEDEPAPPAPTDPHRRRFFRLFAGDVATSVGSMIGVARTLQAESAATAQELLGVTGATSLIPPDEPAPPPPAVRAQGPYLANTAGYRAPFRFEDDAVFAWDQRQLPDILAELEITGAADAVNAITEGAVLGAAVQAQLAAATLALVAARAWDSRPFARRATIRGSANAFKMNRPASAQVALALDRMLAILEDLELDADGKVLADAMRREAEEIIVEATEDHGKIAEHAPQALPGGPESFLHVLTTGTTGAMGGGVFGTALGVITSRHHAGQPIHALVAESRPWLAGARIACWELAQAGVAHALVTDAAAPGCIAAGEVEVVLVSADRIAANGDIAAPVGAYPIALAAQAAGVPFVVCVATTAIDLAVPDADDLTIEDARPTLVLQVRGMRIAPEGVHIRNPVTDVIPASLVTAFVTDEGVLRPPYAPALADAVERSTARRMAARGMKALIGQRQRTVEEAAAADTAAAEGTMAEQRAELVDAAAPDMEPALAHDPTPAVHEEEPFPLDADADAGPAADADAATGLDASAEDLPAEPGVAG